MIGDKMEIQIRQLVAAMPAINKVLSSSHQARTAFRLGRMARALQPTLEAYEKARLVLGEKYGERDERGRVTQVSPDHIAAFMGDLEPVLDETVVVEVPALTEDDLCVDGLVLTPNEANSLAWLITTPADYGPQ